MFEKNYWIIIHVTASILIFCVYKLSVIESDFIFYF